MSNVMGRWENIYPAITIDNNKKLPPLVVRMYVLELKKSRD